MKSGSAPVCCVVACLMPGYGIGYQGALPWRLAKEMKYFKQLTSGTRDPKLQNAVVMGRKTWESIPQKFRPLPNRLNVVVSRQGPAEELSELVQHASTLVKGTNDHVTRHVTINTNDLAQAVQILSLNSELLSLETIYVIGGGEVYNQCIPMSQHLFLTHVRTKHDVKAPPMDTFLDKTQIESNFKPQSYAVLRQLVPETVDLLPETADSEAPVISENGFEFQFALWSREQ